MRNLFAVPQHRPGKCDSGMFSGGRCDGEQSVEMILHGPVHPRGGPSRVGLCLECARFMLIGEYAVPVPGEAIPESVSEGSG